MILEPTSEWSFPFLSLYVVNDRVWSASDEKLNIAVIWIVLQKRTQQLEYRILVGEVINSLLITQCLLSVSIAGDTTDFCDNTALPPEMVKRAKKIAEKVEVKKIGKCSFQGPACLSVVLDLLVVVDFQQLSAQQQILEVV